MRVYICLFKGLLVFAKNRLEQFTTRRKRANIKNKKCLISCVRQINIVYEISQGGRREKFN